MVNVAQRLAKAMAFWNDQHPDQPMLNPNSLARLSGELTQQRYDQILKGGGVKGDGMVWSSKRLKEVARFLGVRWIWLYDGSGPMVEPSPEHRPPLTYTPSRESAGDEPASVG